jgi:hypothetical protein
MVTARNISRFEAETVDFVINVYVTLTHRINVCLSAVLKFKAVSKFNWSMKSLFYSVYEFFPLKIRPISKLRD